MRACVLHVFLFLLGLSGALPMGPVCLALRREVWCGRGPSAGWDRIVPAASFMCEATVAWHDEHRIQRRRLEEWRRGRVVCARLRLVAV
ncbi:hypothetical protein B0H14DRAFT_248823 [Mycena olivaceomarginata]|nr:hypothetical protein B0H14DRAFT_248823 [Mycena olivaceomarginata]